MSEKIYEFLSLDLWDTVIRRKCHPDAIKVDTARYLYIKYNNYIKWEDETIISLMKERVACERKIGNKWKKEGFDDEYKIKDVFLLWIQNVLCVISAEKAEEIAEDLYQHELEYEKQNAYLDPTIVETIKKYKYKKIGYISDFYAGHDFLDEILVHIGFPYKWDVKMVSCEQKYNKRSGRLFELAGKQLGILPEEQIHFGDNAYSDYQIPKKLGIEAVHYLPEEEHKKRKEKESKFSIKEIDSVLKYTDYPITGKKEKISVFFYGFTLWILERCLAQGIKRIFFFTREGEFYKKLYDVIAASNLYGIEPPQSELLEVSRIATFGASLREITIQEMMRIWNQYSCQSMKAFFTSISIDPDEMQKYLIKYQIPYDEVLTYPWQNEKVQQLFLDVKFLSAVQKRVEQQKELLLAYCESKGMKQKEKEKIAIIDIGWRGTIQDNICYLFPEYQIYGYYIGLIPFLNEQPQNAYKEGYINQYKDYQKILMLSTPFEMICNSPNGSTSTYEKQEGKIVAVRKKEETEDKIFFQYTCKIQQDVIQKMQEFIIFTERHYLTEVQFRMQAYKSLEEFIFLPDTACAKAYFELVHNEEFGVGNYVDKRTRFRPFLMIKAVFSEKSRKELKEFLRDTTWPQGYLAKYHLYPALHLYNRLLKKYYKK